MSEWLLATEEEMSNSVELQSDKQLAYYNTFYKDLEAMQVLVDLTRYCSRVTSDPAAMIARLEVINYIKGCCGANVLTDLEAVKAEAEAIVLE